VSIVKYSLLAPILLVSQLHGQFGGIDEFDNGVINPTLWIDAPATPFESLQSANGIFVEGGAGFPQLYFTSQYVSAGALQFDFDYLSWQQNPSASENWTVEIELVNTFAGLFASESARIGLEIYPSGREEDLVLSYYSEASSASTTEYDLQYFISADIGEYVAGIIQAPTGLAEVPQLQSDFSTEPFFQHKLVVTYNALFQVITISVDFNTTDEDDTLTVLGSYALDGVGTGLQDAAVDWDLTESDTFDIFVFGASANTTVTGANSFDLVYAERFEARTIQLPTVEIVAIAEGIQLSVPNTEPGFFYQWRSSTELGSIGDFEPFGEGQFGNGAPFSIADTVNNPSQFYILSVE